MSRRLRDNFWFSESISLRKTSSLPVYVCSVKYLQDPVTGLWFHGESLVKRLLLLLNGPPPQAGLLMVAIILVALSGVGAIAG